MVSADRRTPAGSLVAPVVTDAEWCRRCKAARLDCYQSGNASDPWEGCGRQEETWVTYESDAQWCVDCRARGGRCTKNLEPMESFFACTTDVMLP